jgi:pantetheine-phosphate adenylyltransferase
LLTAAVYPGSFDPVHFGHIDIAERAHAIFGRLVVAVYEHPQKSVLFPVGERVLMMRQALAHLPNVEVASYRGLTVDFVRQQGARVIVRGLRVITDFEIEYQMALMTSRLAPEVEMVCLMTSLEYAFISSSIVKDVAMAGGSVAQLVPVHVEEALRRQLMAPASAKE